MNTSPKRQRVHNPAMSQPEKNQRHTSAFEPNTCLSRICFFRLGATPLFVSGSQATFGGAEVRAYTFAKALAKLDGCEVSFAVRDESGLEAGVREGIYVQPMPRRQRGLQKVINSIRSRMSRKPLPYPAFGLIDADTDVVACFGVHDPTPNVIAASRHHGMRSILFLTSSEDVNAVTGDGNAKQNRRERFREAAIRHASDIVVQTEYQREKLKQRFGRSSQLIRNPIDTKVVEVKTSRSHVLWVGRADCNSKRADVCFSLAKQCPEVPFRIVMNDSDSLLGQQLLAEKLPNVQVDRHIPLHEIDEAYANASVLINTSVSEGFPNAFLQAAKFATPIVSLNVDPDGMLRKHGCGEVAGTEDRMLELIREYHQRGDRVQQKATAARAYVVKYHELTDRVNELAALVTEPRLQRRAAA